MDPILTGVFVVALYKATELLWEKGFDAAWDPVGEGLKERFTRWAGKDKASQRRAAFDKAVPIATELTINAQYPMAGDNNRQRVSAQSLPNGSHRSRPLNLLRHPCVASGLAIRDEPGCCPNLALKGGSSGGVQLVREGRLMAAKVSGKPLNQVFKK